MMNMNSAQFVFYMSVALIAAIYGLCLIYANIVGSPMFSKVERLFAGVVICVLAFSYAYNIVFGV